jgi:cysteine desulfurase
LEKSTLKRYYFDYNASSPLADSVTDYIAKGDFSFGNPSSLHGTGKRSRLIVEDARDALFKIFGLKNTHRLIFHSGATEGLNTIIKGLLSECRKKEEKCEFFYSLVDHSCIHTLGGFALESSSKVTLMNVDKNGCLDFDIEAAVENSKAHKILICITEVNNESGVIWDLARFIKLKEKYPQKVYLCVDSVQSPGKLKDFNHLSSVVDYYTYSGHKLGALKGIGISFIREAAPFVPLLLGGGQQGALRSGTENILGIKSFVLALEELLLKQDIHETIKGRKLLESLIVGLIGDKGEVVALNTPHRSSNTIQLIIYDKRSSNMARAFDISKIDVSTGSACSSGIVKPSRILTAMGYTELEGRSSIRLSFSPYLNEKDAQSYFQVISPILKRFL